jgi:hypothetical protein
MTRIRPLFVPLFLFTVLGLSDKILGVLGLV